jgi:hypothetical protein
MHDSNYVCRGEHLCPSCKEMKTCAFGFCSLVGETKCDRCLYLAEYGPEAGKIIDAAFGVASKLYDASGRVSHWVIGDGPEPWATKEDARLWMREAGAALEKLDTAINIITIERGGRLFRCGSTTLRRCLCPEILAAGSSFPTLSFKYSGGCPNLHL